MQFKNVLFRKTSFLVLWVSTLCMPIWGYAQVSGTVFRDFNADGVKASTSSTSLEPGVSGITVMAYPSSGAAQTTTTSSTGTYSFSGLTLPVRIEFTNLPTGNYSGPQGTNSGTTVQFYNAANSNANLGINTPAHYSQAAPPLVTPKYLNGNPFNDLGGNIANEDALYLYPFGANGDRQNGGTAATTLATQVQIGSTWGTAYDNNRKKLFVASVYKRHAPLGPGETGGRIYVIDNPTSVPGTPTKFIDLVSDLGISVGAVETNAARNLATNRYVASTDDNTFAKAGKVGLGDLDISDDGQFLFVVNLYDKKVYKINIAQAVAGTPNATALPAYTVPACTNGQTRPWGMGMWGGELYLGIVCDASTGTRNDLQGYVQKFNFNTNTWTTVLNFTPTWSKGYAFQMQSGDWQKWEDTYTNFIYQGWQSNHSQPIIGDIEFDEEGSMHLSLLDRTGFQLGHRNYEPFSTNLTTGMTAGELLRTYKDPSTGVFTLENNGSAGPYTSGGTGTSQQDQGGAGTNQGPGGGEFYADDCTGNVHAETLSGGLALKKGSRIIASNHMNPIDWALDTQGTLWLSTVNGLQTQEYQIFWNNGTPSPDFSKQNGLGDLEYLTTPAPIEIGNRVWNDTNKNGIQDAGEAGVAGVTIQLSKFNGTSYVNLVNCTTDANGNYYFSSATGTSATGITYNITELTPNSQFKLSIPTTYNGLMLTAPNIVSGSNADEIDSDADGFGEISFTTGNAGENNHSYDIGFQTPIEICAGEEYTLSVPSGTTGQWYKDGLPIAGATGISYVVTTAGNYNFIGTNVSGCTFSSCTNAAFIAGNCARLGNYVWNDTNADGLNNEAASAGINGVHIQLYKVNGGGSYTLVDSAITANNNGNPGYYQFIVHTFGDYLVRFIAPTGKNLTKTTQTANTDNNSDADGIGVSGVINLVAGTNDSTIDAGFINSCAVGNILYLCGNVKPADADAFDHGMIQYLQGLGNTITPALTQNVAGLGLYNPMTMLPTGITNLNAFDAVIISPTVEGSYSPTLIDSLRKTRLPVLASDYWANIDLGLSNNAGISFQNDVHNGTSQVPFYNYITFNPAPTYGNGVFWGDYASNATTYLWLDGAAKTNGNQGVYYAYEPTDAINNPLTGSPLNNHGRRVFYGIHANGIYENPTNGGAIPSPASAWLNPYTHLTSYGKRYLDSALALMCTTKAPAGSIGNFVWTDTDGDGTQDVGETGINGVKVKLYQDNGSGVYNLIDSTTTATNSGNAGYYAFTGLGSWNYYVSFPTTTGASIPLSIQTTTAATDGNSDANVSTGNSPIFAINASGTGTAKDNPTIDAGYYYCALSMVPGLTINTIDYGPQTAPQPETVTLNAGGNLLPESNVAGFYHSSTSEGALYTFCAEISQPVLPLQNPYTHELTGSPNGFTAAQAYRVAQVVQAAGFNSQTGLGAGNNTVTNLVALQLAAWNAIYDTDYSVTAGNFQSTTSNNVGAVTLANTWLTAAQAITTPTSVVHKLHHASGQDLFETGDVPPITVQVTPPTCSGVGAPDNATMTVVGFSAGQRYQYSTGTTFNSAAATPASPTAIPVGGVVVSNLANATQTYTIRVYDATNDACFTDRTVAINAVICVGSVGNYVWNDVNGNGTQDVSETGINGVTVELYKETAPSSGSYALAQTTTTATNAGNAGYYNFVITQSANYYVHFPTTTSGKFLSTQTTTAATNGNSDANVSTGNSPIFAIDVLGTGTDKDNPTIDAGYHLGVIGNYVWYDTDRNGLQNEPASNGLNGETVLLWQVGNAFAVGSTTTANDANGNPGFYQFTGLAAGTYKVSFPNTVTLPNSATGYATVFDTTALVNGNSDIIPQMSNFTSAIVLAAGEVNNTIDAGFTDCANGGAGSGGQIGISTPTCFTPGAAITFQTTNIAPYTLTSPVMQIWLVHLWSGGTANTYMYSTIDSLTFTHTITNTTGLDSIEIRRCVNTAGCAIASFESNIATIYVCKGSVGNYVWNDTDGNGTQDVGETGINGVTVELYKETAPSSGSYALAQTTTTATNAGNAGYYNFNITESANYYVKFPTTNGGNVLTTATRADGVDNNSDADITGNSPIFAINVNGTGIAKDNPTIDVGYTPSNTCGITPSVDYTLEVSNATPNPHSGFVLDASVVGGEIDFYAQRVQSGGTLALEAATWTATPSLMVSHSVGVTGTAIFTFDGIDSDGATLNPTGLGGLDMSGNSDGFYYGYSIDGTPSTPYTVEATIRVYTNAGNWSSQTQTIVAGLNSTTFIPINFPRSGFVTGAGTGANFANIGAIQIEFVSLTQGADFQIQNIKMPCYAPKGSVGNYVWTDTDGDGTQDVGETGINGVTVELYKETAPSSGSYALAQTTTTANNGTNDGAYNFVIVESANYYVHFPTTTSGKTLSTSTTTAATDGNSDANVSTGNSPIFAIDINGIGTAKDNPTIDAGFKLMPILTAVAGSCDPSANQYNVAGTITGTFPATGQMLVNIAGEGSILYSAPFASSPISYSITGLNSDGANKTVTITFTDAPDLNTSVNYTAPTACITNSCVSGGAGAETHTYTLPFTTTDVVNQAVTLPKFDDMGGTRILEKVLITQKQSTTSAALLENTSATVDSFFLNLNTKGLLTMAGDTLLYANYEANYDNKELPGNVFVPTNGAYPSWLGDINQPIGAGFVLSTLARMEVSSTVITNDLPNFIDPRLNSGWVTNMTGNSAHDDDIWYISPLEMSRSSSKLLTTSLSNYIGAGNLAMTANADAGFDLQGGGGNIAFYLRTKYKTEVTVTYYYCPAAKVGNYVWTDTDADGVQDGSETGINGVTVELYKETAPTSGTYALAQTTTTANDGSNDGAYNFVITESANYYVHFPLVSGADILTTQTTTAATDGNSDANISTGNSPIFAMDVNGTGIAQDNQTIDAGYTPVSSTVGDYVWLDIDKDGQQDANEKGVSGVTVSLINNLNEVVATMQTDAYGYYLFHNVAVGDYTVRFSLPIAYAFTIQEASPSATGSDANGAGYSNTFQVNAGDNITDIDAGIYYEKVFRSGLGNFVWLDVNANGRQDVGELGVSNVAVMLYNTSGTLLQATLTNNAGYYQFLDLTPGNYVVGVRLPLGYQFVNPNVGGNDNLDSDILPSTGKTATIVLPINTFDQSNDAGIVAIVNTQASIGDYVWNDANHNGLQESDEVGVSNVTVELWDDQNNLMQTTRTDAYGYYMFTDITAGFYAVKFELPAGWVFSTADVGTDNDIDSDVITPIGGTDTIRVAEGDRITNVDAGVYNPAATTKGIIGDYVWYDLDKDGIQDATEAGVPGVMVTLYDGSNFVIAQTTTDQNGKYLFIDLPVGTYSVGFSNIREGYTFTTPTQGGDGAFDSDVIPATGKTATVSLTSNAIILDLDAGIYPTTRGGGYASLGDRVWYDVNNDGVQDAGEVGASNIIVRLYDATNTQIRLTLTDGSGRYLFSGLNPGTYTVNFTLPSGCTFSPQKQGNNDNTDSDVNILGTTAAITLMVGENNMRIDAGLYKSTGTASIGDFVWNDINNDGAQNVGEKGVSGVSVTLYNASGIAIATTVTDKNGYYLFPYMNAANYSVGFNNFPAGFALVPAGQGGDSSTDSDPNVVTGKTAVFSLAAGQAKTDIDAGLYAARASLGDYVWNDVNVNGLQDVTEEGVAGITVHLFNSSNQYISSSVTDANGYYLFYNLTAGNYYVNVSDLPTYTVFTVSNAGDDVIDSDINPVTALSQTVTLAANDFNKTVDAGLNMDANASLEGYVWFDANGDGLQDVTEAPVSGVLVTLESPTGVALSRTVSGADGMYHFENVLEGSYKVRFSNIPTGSRFTNSDANGGNNDRLDSDANPITGLSTDTYPILSGQRAHAADAGLLPPSSIAGTAFEDVGTPPNGLQDPTEITFSNILVMLYTSADSVLVGTTLTDKKGNYLFAGLYQDNYFVVFDAISGRSFTAKNIDNNLSDDIDSDVNFFGGTDVINLGVGENIINVDAGYLPAGFIFPVTMAYFTAELVNTDGLLKWKTTAEVNTKHFEIYRSLDEFSYEKIGNNVTATGTPTTSTSYNTFDYNVNKLNVDRVFYRLKIIDVDGSFNWSNVVALNLTHTDQTIFAQVYPNPAETRIWVDYQLFDGATADLKITNSVGQAVYTETIKAKDSLQQLSIDISRWADGVYYLNIQSENGNFVRKIIKE